mgnify:CR=1 FL=1
MSKYMDTKTGSLEESILGIWQEAAKKQQSETNKNDKSDDGEGMDAVQPKAVKKKLKALTKFVYTSFLEHGTVVLCILHKRA